MTRDEIEQAAREIARIALQKEVKSLKEQLEEADRIYAEDMATMTARVAELKNQLAEMRENNERLAWNLAGCSTYALGYGLDEEHAKDMALPALENVKRLALKAREADRANDQKEKMISPQVHIFTPMPCAECGEAYTKLMRERMSWRYCFLHEPFQMICINCERNHMAMHEFARQGEGK